MAQQYILDSNICIHLLRNRKEVVRAIAEVGWRNCHITELTVVELYYGAGCSQNPRKNRAEVFSFLDDIDILPFSVCINEFCRQKFRLRKSGALIEDTDLYIGASAVAMGYTLVTENIKHLSRLENINLLNWVNR